MSAVLSSVPVEQTDWRRASVKAGHGWRVDTFGLPAAFRYRFFKHTLPRCKTQSLKHTGPCTYSVFTQKLHIRIQTQICECVSDHNTHSLSSLSHSSSTLRFSQSLWLAHAVFWELKLKNKSHSWQQRVYVWDALLCVFFVWMCK